MLTRRDEFSLRDLADMVRMTIRLCALVSEEARLLRQLRSWPDLEVLHVRLRAVREEASLINCSMPEKTQA